MLSKAHSPKQGEYIVHAGGKKGERQCKRARIRTGNMLHGNKKRKEQTRVNKRKQRGPRSVKIGLTFKYHLRHTSYGAQRQRAEVRRHARIRHDSRRRQRLDAYRASAVQKAYPCNGTMPAPPESAHHFDVTNRHGERQYCPQEPTLQQRTRNEHNGEHNAGDYALKHALPPRSLQRRQSACFDWRTPLAPSNNRRGRSPATRSYQIPFRHSWSAMAGNWKAVVLHWCE